MISVLKLYNCIKTEQKHFKLKHQNIDNNQGNIKSATYSAGFWYRYTGMSAQTLAPKKIKKLLKYCL